MTQLQIPALAQPRIRDDLVLTPKGLRHHGQIYPCSIGRGGLSDSKHEGDGATPKGCHHIVGLLYRPDRLPQPSRWAEKITPGDLWSDAPNQPEYNQLTKAPYAHSHERLRRADPLYDLILITNWNWPHARPGYGSAIFIHQWRRARFPTEGCIALRRDHLIQLCQQITRGTRLIVS